MALNKKAIELLKLSWLSMALFALYPVLDNIIVQQYLLHKNIMPYLLSGEPVGLIIAVILPPILYTLRTKNKLRLRKFSLVSLLKHGFVQGTLITIGNVMYLLANRDANATIIITLSTVPSLIAAWRDIKTGEERRLVAFPLITSLLPILVIFFESVNGWIDIQHWVSIGLLLMRAGVITLVEYYEKEAKKELVDSVALNAVRQLFICLFSIGIALGLSISNIDVTFDASTKLMVEHGIWIVAVMILSNLALSLKIESKSIGSVSETLILLNGQIPLGIMFNAIIYALLFQQTQAVSILFVTVSVFSVGCTMMSILFTTNKKVTRSIPT